MRLLYTAVLSLLLPLLLPLMWLRGWRGRWRERFGFVEAPPQGVDWWVHAASVGEVQAGLPLIRELLARGTVLVTTNTPTGSDRVRQALGEKVWHSYAPLDLPGTVALFLARVRPRYAVVLETELWPNRFQALHRRGVPLVLANARLSPRSFAHYRRARAFCAQTLSACSVIAAQSEADAQRFITLGAAPAQVRVLGNLKLDLQVPQDQVEAGRRLRAHLGLERPVWIAASTHEGEEVAALAAHQEILKSMPDALLILAPRHPQRFDAVARQIEQSGLSFVRRSAFESFPNPEAPGASAGRLTASSGGPAESRIPNPVFLADSMGELFLYYAAADLAFVGGSLAPVGGHNVLEPAALGRAVLFGPQMFNFAEARALLLNTGAAVEIAEAAALGPAVAGLLLARSRAQAMGQAGQAAVEANRGALRKLLALLEAPRR